ncbi:MAG: hypothetical protein AB7O32_05520 [Vicinamibacterales bacterium]
MRIPCVVIAGLGLLALAPQSAAQIGMGGSTSAPKPRPTGRVAIFADAWSSDPDEGPTRGVHQLISSAAFRAPETEENGLDYGLDLRHSGFSGGTRPERMSVNEAFAGVRFAQGRARVRGGHIWLNDLGALGSIAGGHAEIRQSPAIKSQWGRWRIGGFYGGEPRVFDSGYFAGVRKLGGYVALDGEAGRRHSLGYVRVMDRSILERSVLTTNNFFAVRRTFFLYQAAEYDLVQPAGQARAGLNYFFTNARLNPARRVELQGTYNRGRSVDTRGLADDLLNGRQVTQATALGLSYESIGGRVTLEPWPRVRVYAGLSEDRSNREDRPAHRTMLGGYAPNVGDSGFDLAASDTRTHRVSGDYHSRYVSVGRQIGRRVYVSGDYTTSLSIVQFSRSDGIVIEDKPSSRRVSGTAAINVGTTTTLQVTVDRTWDRGVRELRVLTGLSYRFR